MQALVFRHNPSRQVVTKLLGFATSDSFVGPLAPLQLERIADPTLPASDWLTIRTRLCGICGSDSKQVFLKGNMDNPMTSLITFPQVLGHEVVGTIDRVGPAVDARRVGQRVVLNPWLSCGPRGIEPPCPACTNGDFSICANFTRGNLPAGIHTGNSSAATGGFAALVPAHDSMAIAIPDDISDESAVLGDPFSVSFHGILKAPPPPGGVAVVYGCGTLGLCAIATLRGLYPSTQILAIARYPHQRALATRLGADLVIPNRPPEAILGAIAERVGTELLKPWYGMGMLNGGADVVYDTVGLAETLEVGVRITRPRGSIVVTGVEVPERFEWTPLYFKEIHLVGSNAFGHEDFEGRRQHAMQFYFEFVRSGRVDVTPILTHRFRLDEYQKAFAACFDQGASEAVKVLFAFDHDSDR